MASQHDALGAILRNDFHSFLQKSFECVTPGSELLDNWHLRYVAGLLEKCSRREIKRLIICMPPRSLKSMMSSVAFPAWLLGHDPSHNVICASYADDLAYKFSRDCRRLMESSWYRKTFPKTRFDKQKLTEQEMETTANGCRIAASVRGSMTGRGGNTIIVDDPIKTSEAPSEVERARVNEWYSNTLYSRLNNKNDDVIIIVMQRAHVDDLVGYVRDRDDWTIVELPAIAPERQIIQLSDTGIYERQAGEPLHAARENVESLARTRTNVGSAVFEAQYQQKPVPPGGNMLKSEWFKRYEPPPDINHFDTIIQSWDTASETGDANSFSVCLTFGVRENRYYVLDVLRERWEFPALVQQVERQARTWGANAVLIENAASGRALLQTLSLKTGLALIPCAADTDKITRVARVSSYIEANRVYLPSEAPWLAEFLNELLAFPKAKFDDQVDALAHFLLWAIERDTPPLRIQLNVREFGNGSRVRDRYFERTGSRCF